jgi:hypothetical protein
MAIKGGRPEDFCTQIDVDNEHLITSAIQAHFPTHHIIGEEAVGSGEIPLLSNDIPTWIIDRTCVCNNTAPSHVFLTRLLLCPSLIHPTRTTTTTSCAHDDDK